MADKYALSDNFHQSVMGGTGANHIMLGFGDAIFYSDGKGHAGCAAGQPDRESESAAGDQQLLRSGWLLRRLLQQLRRHHAAGRALGGELPPVAGASRQPELPAGRTTTS